MTRAGAQSSSLTNEDIARLRTAISAGPIRPFLVTLDRSHFCTKLTAHVARETIKASRHSVKRDFSRRIAALGIGFPVQVRLHSRHALDNPRTLEAFIAKFWLGERLYDPIGVFDEAERLVVFARELRRRLEGEVKGIYWSSRWRTTYVLLNEEAFLDGYCLRRQKLVAAEGAVIDAYEASVDLASFDRPGRMPNSSSDRLEVSRNVRLCFDVPAVPLVPVDAASFTHHHAPWSIRNLLQAPELATLARASILGALFGMGSAGIAVAKLPPLENRPMLTGAHTAIGASTAAARVGSSDRNTSGYADSRGDAVASSPSGAGDQLPGGSGLHLLWRDPINGAVGGNAALDRAPRAATEALIRSEEVVNRDRFLEISTTGATFAAPASGTQQGKLDLRWLAQGERTGTDGPKELAGRPQSSAFPAIQPGLTAVLGLSRLMGSDMSDGAYGTALEEVQLHFGLPRSVRAEARWHSANTAHSPTASRQNRDFFEGKVLLAQSKSYWDYLREMGPRNPAPDPRDSYSPSQRRDQRTPRSCSSC